MNQALQLLSSRDESYHFKTGAEVNKVGHCYSLNSILLYYFKLNNTFYRFLSFLHINVIIHVYVCFWDGGCKWANRGDHVLGKKKSVLYFYGPKNSTTSK